MRKRYTIILLILFTYSVIFPVINHMAGRWEIVSRACGVMLLLFFTKQFGKFVLSSLMDKVMFFYIFWLLFSGFVAYLLPLSSVKLWIYGLGVTGVPMLFYYVGRNLSLDTEKMLRVVWVIGMVHVVLGILLYEQFPYPSWWKQVLGFVNLVIKKGTFGTGLALRMMSMNGSLAFGVLSTTTLLLSIYFFLRYNLKTKYALYSAISMLAVFFSLQRSAWFMAIFAIFALLLLWFDPLTKLDSRQNIRYKKVDGIMYLRLCNIIIMILLLIIMAILLRSLLEENVLGQIESRFTLASIGIGLQERRVQQIEGWQIFTKYPLGVGLGQLGFTAIFSDISGCYPKVPDGNYIKIIGELGIVGLIFQITFFIPAALSLFKVIPVKYSNKQKYMQMMLLCLVIIQYYSQAVGTNVWDLYYVNALFWLFTGLMVKEFHLLVSRKSKP